MIPQTSSSQQQPVFNMHSLVSREKKLTNKTKTITFLRERENFLTGFIFIY